MNHPCRSIYYRKCDRPAAFHGTGETFRRDTSENLLAEVLRQRFPGKPVALHPAPGQGNHITGLAAVDGTELLGSKRFPRFKPTREPMFRSMRG